MRELAEMTSQSQKEAFDVVRKRIEENVEGIRNEIPGRCRGFVGCKLLTSSQSEPIVWAGRAWACSL